MRVWPNPTNGSLNIQFTNHNSPITEIKVYDVYGKLVDVLETCHGAFLQTVQIDLSRYPDGIYFLRASNGAVTKVVKQ
ncbi:MAG: T9SS type A sorting domain-containing protein [Bacteroidales bacterium]|nr:T9SS type A sorting domain-containing protein [Bacteroidales bacterium]